MGWAVAKQAMASPPNKTTAERPNLLSGYFLREVPVGIEATGMRREAHASGSVSVPADRYWGGSTQRSLNAGFTATIKHDTTIIPRNSRAFMLFIVSVPGFLVQKNRKHKEQARG